MSNLIQKYIDYNVKVISAPIKFLKNPSIPNYIKIGVVSFFAPICISLVLLDGDDINVNAHFLVFFCGLGSFVAIYFFGKAMLNN